MPKLSFTYSNGISHHSLLTQQWRVFGGLISSLKLYTVPLTTTVTNLGSPNELWEVTEAELIQMNDSSSVFYTTITSTFPTFPTPLDAALKFDHTPRPTSSLAWLKHIFVSVDRLHQHGASHGDLYECRLESGLSMKYERNILVKDGNPVLIDLKKRTLHKCNHCMKVLRGAIAPELEEFRCPEMYIAWGCGQIIYAELQKERMVTYGTEILSDCVKRLDRK
ncbi:hypothetical protein C8R44DRAFT_726764 [Mycena epipterygia]|nr:hypothetical protein C8R44DRAFT_726764 [Mycena epipterygia]